MLTIGCVTCSSVGVAEGHHTGTHIGHDCHVIAVQENLRQLCVFKLANDSGKPWLWWEYVTKFGDECSMVDKTYDEDCAEKVSINRQSNQRLVSHPRRIPCCSNVYIRHVSGDWHNLLVLGRMHTVVMASWVRSAERLVMTTFRQCSASSISANGFVTHAALLWVLVVSSRRCC